MQITRNMISQALSRKEKTLPTFCIIKDRITNRIDNTVNIAWIVVGHPSREYPVDVSRQQALDLISLYEMEPVVKQRSGTIYDTVDQRYLNMYKGKKVNI